MKKRKLLAALALTLALCLLPATMLAAEYNVANGDITVTRKADGSQWVKQGDQEKQDEAPVLTGTALNTVVRLVAVDEGGVVNVTLKDAHIETDADQCIIDIAGKTTANIRLEGEVLLGDEYSGVDNYKALIHVSEGTLNLTGSEGATLDMDQCAREGAVIGSDQGEDFNGTIHISNLEIVDMDNDSSDGALIGSGWDGDFNGTVILTNVKAEGISTQSSAALIGSGEGGAFNGRVVLETGTELSYGRKKKRPVIGEGYKSEPVVSTGVIVIQDGVKIVNEDNKRLILGGNDEDDQILIALGDDAVLGDYTGAQVKAGAYDEHDIEICGKLTDLSGEPEEPQTPAETYYAQGEAFRVVDKDGNDVAYEETLEDGVLTIKAPKGASIIGALEDMQLLSTKGATELRFGTSVLPIAELYHGVGMQGDTVVLTQNGKLTIGGVDYSSLLM